MTTAQLVAVWERRLKAEGLTPLDKFSCKGVVVVRAQLITPHRRRYVEVAEPGRLAQAIEAWIAGDASRFIDAGRVLLERRATKCSRGWPKRRAKILIRVCWALAEGRIASEAAGRHEDLAYRYLRRLNECLLEDTSASSEDANDVE